MLAGILVFLILQTLPTNRGEERKPPNKKQDVATPSPTPASKAVVNDDKCACAERKGPNTQTQQAPEKSFWGDLPTWGLFVVGSVAAWIAICTLKDIQRQTRTAKIAARAAKTSADAALLN